uniref:Uncharacterized protein n=1 Tax=Nyssomyia neivai TaxID=330878 RepID=A0A1L8D8I2_9DIPT
MVDPHRHVRNLTEEQKQFLADCEKEFANRFTERDLEFGSFFKQEPREPPIVDGWMQGQGNRHHGQDRNYQRGWRHRGGRNDYNRPPWRTYNQHYSRPDSRRY